MLRRISSATALLAIAMTASPADGQNRSPAKYEAMAREFLSELVEINTTNSEGDNTAAAQAMANRLLAAGFPAEDVHVIGPRERKGNLVARLRGTDAGLKPILLLAHLDVVEANPEDWTLPPFKFIEQDGFFFGRGVADDKDEAAIHVVNLIRMKEEGFVPNRDIIVALTADEEGGGSNGVQWLLENHRDLVDAAFTINEGGAGILENGKKVANSVGAAEKKFAIFVVEATNPGGHSSVPRDDNAIYDLADALTKIGKLRLPIRLNEVSQAFFARAAPTASAELGAAMRAISDVPVGQTLRDGQGPREAIAVLQRDPRYNSIMRTTCVATLLEGGHASNALPQRAQATVNCRMLPDENPDDVHAMLQEAAGPGVKVIMRGRASDSPASPLTEEVLGPIERITAEMWPGVTVVPIMGTGATDNRYFRSAGIPGYGVAGLFYSDANAHGMNEKIETQAYYEGLEFLYRLTRAYSSEGASRTPTVGR